MVGRPSSPPPLPPPPAIEFPEIDTSAKEAQAVQIANRARRRRAGLAQREDTVLTTGLGLGVGQTATTSLGT